MERTIETSRADLIAILFLGTCAGLTLLVGAWPSLVGAGPSPPPVKAAPVASNACSGLESFAVDRLYLEGPVWSFRGRSGCGMKKGLLVRLAFYDRENYRHGFKEFRVEPLLPGEKVRMDGIVPRPGAVAARVFALNPE
jgi:hypothetical protein